MREIKFRGKCVPNSKFAGEWVTGGYVEPLPLRGSKQNEGLIIAYFGGNTTCTYHVIPKTVGQFTGLTDKNGREIYEGDIVEFYTLDTYCINPDCEPHLIGYNYRICKKSGEIEFEDGVFGIERDYGFTELLHCGFYKHEIKDLKEMEKDAYFDTNGYEINDSIVGVEVIGNIHDNPELMN